MSVHPARRRAVKRGANMIDLTSRPKGNRDRKELKALPKTRKELTGDRRTGHRLMDEAKNLERRVNAERVEEVNKVWRGRKVDVVGIRRRLLGRTPLEVLHGLQREGEEVGEMTYTQLMALACRVCDLGSAVKILEQMPEGARRPRHDTLHAACLITSGDYPAAASIMTQQRNMQSGFETRILAHSMAQRRTTHPSDHSHLRTLVDTVTANYKLNADDGTCRHLVHLATSHADAVHVKKSTGYQGVDAVISCCAELPMSSGELAKCEQYLHTGHVGRLGYEAYLGAIGEHPATTVKDLQAVWLTYRRHHKDIAPWMLSSYLDSLHTRFTSEIEKSNGVVTLEAASFISDMERKFAHYITSRLNLSPTESVTAQSRRHDMLAPRAWEYLMDSYSLASDVEKVEWLMKVANGVPVSKRFQSVYETARSV